MKWLQAFAFSSLCRKPVTPCYTILFTPEILITLITSWRNVCSNYMKNPIGPKELSNQHTDLFPFFIYLIQAFMKNLVIDKDWI